MLNMNPSLKFEKRSIFHINFLFIILVIISFLYNISLRYFFYFNIITTLLISYIYFQKSHSTAKKLILTNLFIFFYFLYPDISAFIANFIHAPPHILIILYNIIISLIFLSLSGDKNKFLGNLSKFNGHIFSLILLIGTVFGLIFTILKEPIPQVFSTLIINETILNSIFFLLFSSLLIAISEQIIFSGFIFNTYKKLTSKKDAIYQTTLIFVLFHFLRFEALIKHYYINFTDTFFIFLIGYYLFLLIFMGTCLYLYSLKSKKYEGNFLYPVALHTAADFSLFLFTIIGIS